jgi:hypothetical protein
VTRQEAVRKLKATIEEWQAANADNIDGYAKAVCRRLLDSEAAASFAAVRPDGTRWEVLLGDCIIAERSARTLRHIVAAAIQGRAQAEEAAEHVEWLARFFEKSIVTVDGEQNPVADAINLLGGEVYTARLNAERVLKERSRKSDIATQRSAGIGWIKESVRRASGAPNLEHARVLAEAALGGEVTTDSVNKAVMPDDALSFGYHDAKAGRSWRS